MGLSHRNWSKIAVSKSFPIVAIGASAGGLEAFTQILNHLPTDTGLGIVLIQHLEPDHHSLLSDILARTTQMPVTEVEDGVSVEPDHVYVIPPNRKMVISQGVLKLMPRQKTEGRHLPINAFFESLAAERGSQAIGVVLSGLDRDGAQGLEAIKAGGGLTFAQDVQSSQFEGMPQSAAATGCVDFILPPAAIAEQLARISDHPYVIDSTPAPVPENLPDSNQALSTIFALLRAVTGVDFSAYKQNTIRRRIERRMVLHHLAKLEDYAQYLQDNSAEVEALYQELLIKVTSFFRDPQVFQSLKEQVFPNIVPDQAAAGPIRIWVPGCATGQEVYSLAICLLEFLDQHSMQPQIQIFATDISEPAIEEARAGIYPESQMVNVSPERLRRFFVQVEAGYQISKPVRELCVFALQDLSSDPPFSDLDLISCRNVLIYMGPLLQKRVLPIFHYSLKPTGFLILGTSESLGESSDLFAGVDKKQRIYARASAPTRVKFDFATNQTLLGKVNPSQRRQNAWSGLDIQKQADQIALNHYAPVSIVINDGLDILHFRGETSPYLRPAAGEPSFNLLKMARPGLLMELRTAIYQAKRQDAPVRKQGLRIEGDEQLGQVRIEVLPFRTPPAQEQYCLVLFEAVPLSGMLSLAEAENPGEESEEGPGRGEQTGPDPEITSLSAELAVAKQELAATQEYLQLAIQEQEAANQDLRIANEEVLSSNEELQSTNEELETAKEEIQATNEELRTTNQELQSRNLETRQINNDLINLLSSVNIPILILGGDLQVRRFTPSAQKIFNLISTDVGRPFSNLKLNLTVSDLEGLILEVIASLSIKQLEVQDPAGYWYELQIRPYKTTENQIDGVVLVLVDIDARKRSAEQIKIARDFAEGIVETVREPLVVLNADLSVVTANQSFYQAFETSAAQTQGHQFFELGNGQWNIPELRSRLAEIPHQHTQLKDFEVVHNFERIGPKTMLLNARSLAQPAQPPMILLSISDFTEYKQLEAERVEILHSSEVARYTAESANRTKDEFLSILSHELRNPLSAMIGWSQLLLKGKLNAAKTTRAIETIERSAKTQAQLIEDLLDISRITTGKLRLNTRPVELHPMITAAIEVVHLAAEAKNIQLEARLSPESPRILGDTDRLQQVLWNLLSNAIKFTPPGGRVEVQLAFENPEEIDSPAALIRVSDTGQGINADFLPHVFDRFRQADGKKTRSNSGLGLGLSIVRHLVELHGGTVHAESPGEGQGTTMIVRLPLPDSLEDRSLPRDDLPLGNLASKQSQLVEDIPSLAGLQVLVVDDDLDTCQIMITALEQYDARVTAAASASEALSVLTASPGEYDALLSDLGMPQADGYALIRQVRELSAEAGGQIPAAAITAYVKGEDRQEALSAGFQMHIPKPVEPAYLGWIVATLVGRTKRQ